MAVRRRQWLDVAHGTSAAAEMLAAASAEEAAAAAALSVRRVGAVEDLRCLDEDLDSARCGAAPASACHGPWLWSVVTPLKMAAAWVVSIVCARMQCAVMVQESDAVVVQRAPQGRWKMSA